MSTNMFLKLTDISGESEDEKHSGEIEILGWGQTFEQPTTPIKASTGHTLEKCKHEPMSITKYVDSATPHLLKAIWAGKTIAEGTLTCYRAHKENAPVDFIKIKMTDVIITTYGVTGAEGDIPQEEIALSYGKIDWNYKPMDKLTGDAKDPLPASADLILNKVG